MPRPRSPDAVWIAIVAIALALPSTLRSAALAATAGTLFEAAPFVLAGSLIPRASAGCEARGGRFVSRTLGLLGCGCTGGAGALALPALILCWLIFGPAIALGRAAAALAVGYAARRRLAGTHEDAPDPLDQLARLAPVAFAAAVLAEALRDAAADRGSPWYAAGLVVGAALFASLAPCTTGAVAVAAGLRDVAPAASAAILVVAGIFSARLGGRRPRRASRRVSMPAPRSARCAHAVLALVCAELVCHGASGFVNPRFIVPIGGAALVAAALAIRGAATRARYPLAVPALMLGTYFVGSPLPERTPLATTLDDAYPGEAVRFIGEHVRDAGVRGRGATLVRYTITCCRADAEARAVRLDRTLPTKPGDWYDARGSLALEATGYVLHVATIARIAPPADPFAYR